MAKTVLKGLKASTSNFMAFRLSAKLSEDITMLVNVRAGPENSGALFEHEKMCPLGLNEICNVNYFLIQRLKLL
ncbi:hypothetical protein Hanom_Chr00s088290g01797701 [Helianthus anomalus]